jgi:CRP-like cAMP-binding protein
MVTKLRPSFDAESFLGRVGDARSICKYHKGQVVFSQGDLGDSVFYIQKGRAKVTVVSEHGKEVVIAILGAQEFFGEGCLAGQAQRIATVTTTTDSVIARLENQLLSRYSIRNQHSPKSSLRIFWLGASVSKQTLSINCSIQARSVLLACSCCWQTSARKGTRASDRENQPRDAGGNDWNNTITRELRH